MSSSRFSDRPMPKTFPQLELGRSARLRSKLLDFIVTKTPDLMGERLTPEVLESWVTATMAGFGDASGVRRGPVEASLQPSLGRVLDWPLLSNTARRLAVGVDQLKAGRPVVPFSGHLEPQVWTPLEFMDMAQHQTTVTFWLEGVAGAFCGENAFKAVSVNDPKLWNLMSWVVGDRHSGNARELVGTMLWGELVHHRGQVGSDGRMLVGFARYHVDEQLARHNRRLVSDRRKLCPARYTHLCVGCPVGRDLCRCSARPTTVNADWRNSFLQRREQFARQQGVHVHAPSDASPGQGRPEPDAGRQPDAVDEPGPGRGPRLPLVVRPDRPGDAERPV